MTMETLKEKIIAANKAYRIGRPIMTDIEFDNLCDEYEAQVSPEEWKELRNSLHEETGRVKHPFIMGSLDKLKIEEPEKIYDWIQKYNIQNLSISAKVDGISCRLHYDENGKFVSGTTRGDGELGVDITDKVKYVKGIPKYLNYINLLWSHSYDIRGELVITNKDFEPLASTLKNPRNACAGIMGQKEANPELLKHVSFIAYEIMGGELEKNKQFIFLEDFGFNVVFHVELPIKDYVFAKDKIKKLLEYWIKYDYGFPTDGIVVSDVNYKAEKEYRPKAQRAVKIANLLSSESVVRNIVWEKPSKNGRISPVAIIDGTDIDGACVSRVTVNNIDWINMMNLKIGSRVTVTRSNGVIPKIIEVENDGSETDIKLPTKCPYCGSKLKQIGVDICCTNSECGAIGYAKIRIFLTNLGIKHVSLKTLENLDIDTFEKLINFKADKSYKVQTRFENDLKNQMWSVNEITLFKALPFKNVAEKTLDKIIEFYGWENVKSNPTNFFNVKTGYPTGIGEKVINSFAEIAESNFDILNQIINDKRWTGKKYNQNGIEDNNNMKNNGMSICFTGKLETFSRNEANDYAKEHGFDVLSGVNKNLTYLVTNSSEMTSKMKNAIKFGTKIITEEEFIKMCGGL